MAPEPTEYQLRVRGQLDPERAAWLGATRISHAADGDSLIAALVRDQAELFGLLAKVRDLSLVLLSVQTGAILEGPTGSPLRSGVSLASPSEPKGELPAAAEDLFRSLVESSPELMTFHVDDTIVYINPAGAAMLGAREPSELIGLSVDTLIQPEWRAAGALRRRRMLAGEPVPYMFENTLVRLDGQYVAVEAASVLTTYKGVRGIQVTARDISARKRAEESLRQSEQQYRALFDESRRSAREFAALYQTAADLATHKDLPGLLNAIVERATDLLTAPGGIIYVYDAERDDLELAIARQHPTMLGARLKMGEGAAGRVAQNRVPLLVEDYHSWPERSLKFEAVSYGSIVQVPMLARGDLIGVLGVYEIAPSTRRFGEADARLLSLFAAQAAGAVHQTRMLEQTSARAQQLELLYDAGLTLNRMLEPGAQLELLSRIAMQAVQAERVEFFHYDPARRALIHAFGIGAAQESSAAAPAARLLIAEADGLVDWVSRNHRPLNLHDVTNDARYKPIDAAIRSGLWVPLEHEDQPQGVIVALSTRAGAFSRQDERLLVLFANQLSSAMENSRLFKETR